MSAGICSLVGGPVSQRSWRSKLIKTDGPKLNHGTFGGSIRIDLLFYMLGIFCLVRCSHDLYVHSWVKY